MLARPAIVSPATQLPCVPTPPPPPAVLVMQVIMTLALSFVWLATLHASPVPQLPPCALHAIVIQEGISLAADIVAFVVRDTWTPLLMVSVLCVPTHV